MSSNQSANQPAVPTSKPSYVNARGTIYKVKGAEPLPMLTPTEQRNHAFRAQAFLALRFGFMCGDAHNRNEFERRCAPPG